MSPRKTSLLAAIALVITFVVGAIVGVVADRAFILRAGMPLRSPTWVVSRLDHRLHFTEEQRVQVKAIIERRQQRIAEVWTNVRPTVRREIEETNIEIDRLLTPEQRIEFAKIRMRLMPRRTGDGIRFQHD
jgi:hypothetical protein